MFKKVLVANRGEIAVRVIRACQELGIKAVAVYSTADCYALHTQIADEAYLLGEPPPLQSYLNINKIIEIAKQCKAEAIHPGYGFLAENPYFAKQCEENGLIFIGPSPETIEFLGNKVKSREKLHKEGVPIIPGMKITGGDIRDFEQEAEKVGYPVLIKAAAGGGGKGMRIVSEPSKLKDAVEGARREAKSAFGDESVYLEKFLEDPRHIEFQILADNYGNIVHLFERECSIQRRHQKIIEETPSTALDPELRQKMGESAVKVAKTTGYRNAGTVEFLLDKNKNFYFLEVNTRLQVEHPITEMTTGKDLVHLQLLIASGEKLPFKQEELSQRGHSIECRIYAENPAENFLPSAGKVLFLKEPVGPRIRVDSGIYSGCEVPIYYDPILAKLITWGSDREISLARMVKALKDYVIIGIETNIEFLIDILDHPEFKKGNINTNFIPRYFPQYSPEATDNLLVRALAVAAVFTTGFTPAKKEQDKRSFKDPWLTLGAWRLGR